MWSGTNIQYSRDRFRVLTFLHISPGLCVSAGSDPRPRSSPAFILCWYHRLCKSYLRRCNYRLNGTYLAPCSLAEPSQRHYRARTHSQTLAVLVVSRLGFSPLEIGNGQGPAQFFRDQIVPTCSFPSVLEKEIHPIVSL
jgi:hypothetical protein